MTQKELFRGGCLGRLRGVKKHLRYIHDKKVIAKLYQIIKQGNIQTIMLYLPLKIEVDTMPLIGRLRKEKRGLFVPFMEDESFRLVKYRLPLFKRKFGIREPRNSKQIIPKTIDLAIVPVVGIDSALKRVGFGKGMYDRFFEKEQKKIKKILFVSRIFCATRMVVTDSYDVAGDVFLSPKKSCFKRNNRVLNR